MDYYKMKVFTIILIISAICIYIHCVMLPVQKDDKLQQQQPAQQPILIENEKEITEQKLGGWNEVGLEN